MLLSAFKKTQVTDRHRMVWASKLLVIIDEASVVSPQLLGTADSQLRAIGDSSKLFGGIGVVYVR